MESEERRRLISQRFQEALRLSGLNQTQLAEKVGCRQGTISRWNSGEDVPTTEFIPAVSLALNVNPLWLLAMSEVRSIDPDEREAAQSLAVARTLAGAAATDRSLAAAFAQRFPNLPLGPGDRVILEIAQRRIEEFIQERYGQSFDDLDSDKQSASLDELESLWRILSARSEVP